MPNPVRSVDASGIIFDNSRDFLNYLIAVLCLQREKGLSQAVKIESESAIGVLKLSQIIVKTFDFILARLCRNYEETDL